MSADAAIMLLLAVAGLWRWLAERESEREGERFERERNNYGRAK